jgi:hypothetical protein
MCLDRLRGAQLENGIGSFTEPSSCEGVLRFARDAAACTQRKNDRHLCERLRQDALRPAQNMTSDQRPMALSCWSIKT